ncbi:DUF3011 domain-containing protein [Lysobacter terrae]
MKTLLKPQFLKPLLAALCLLALSAPAMAQITARSYATEDLRTLSYNDQERVIRQEYREQSGGREIADDQLRFYLDQINRSNWRFSDIKRDISQSLAGSQGPGYPGYPGGPGYEGGAIRCESTSNRPRECRTPWDGPSRVSRQLSDTRCVEGSNWNSQYGKVTVWGGCRAEFVGGWGGGGQGQTIRCESSNNRVTNCPTPWRGRSQLVRQLSDTRCREGQNWNSNRGQVSVWSGCRGEFASAGGGWNGGGDSGYTTTCASQDGRYTTCNWPPGQGRPRLIQQLSSQACIEGRTWGMAGNNRIWVNGGCRGRFGN